jgi:hypothetical protein
LPGLSIEQPSILKFLDMLRAPVRLKCPVPGASAAMTLRLIVDIRTINVFLFNIPPPE